MSMCDKCQNTGWIKACQLFDYEGWPVGYHDDNPYICDKCYSLGVDIASSDCSYDVAKQKIFLWVNSDLDGVASTILLGNMCSCFEYRPIFFGDFEDAYTKWAESNLENYDKVFIVGMPLDQSLINRLDDYKLVFITDKKEKYNTFYSALISEEKTSCCKLIYNKFKDKIQFSKKLVKLVAYVDNYNSQSLKFEESRFLNAIFRKSGAKKFTLFVNRFWNGFDGFTNKEVNLANQFYKEIDEVLENLTLFQGEFRGFKVLSTFTKASVNEVSKGIFDNYDTDVVVIVNPDTKYVSFRKNRESKADIKFMAENLCNGGGGEFSSGGNITQKFLDFTTKLAPL